MCQARPVTDADDPMYGAAIVAELTRRTGVCWLRHGPRSHALWHVWHDGALCLVTGGTEQPLPGLEDGSQVEVVLRSKDDGGRLATWVGTLQTVPEGDPRWGPTTAALAAARLNTPDLAAVTDRWAAGSVVYRVVPTGQVSTR